MPAENKDLKTLYNSFYKNGENSHYTPLLFGGTSEDADSEPFQAISSLPSWEGKTVLDVGCGTGLLVSEVARRGAKQIVGLDFSEEAIRCAKERNLGPNVTFACADFNQHEGRYDVVTSLGTLEHMDDPLAALKRMKHLLEDDGVIILTSPNWVNPRGYILQTLRFLFDAPVTLADLHFLTPVDFQKWADALGMKLTWSTFDHNWAQGEKLIKDFKRRLPNILIRDMKDATTQARIDAFIAWIEEHVATLEHTMPSGGALGRYKFEPR